jgi:hypothetical protein
MEGRGFGPWAIIGMVGPPLEGGLIVTSPSSSLILSPEHGVKRLLTTWMARLGPFYGDPAWAVRLHRWCVY